MKNRNIIKDNGATEIILSLFQMSARLKDWHMIETSFISLTNQALTLTYLLSGRLKLVVELSRLDAPRAIAVHSCSG